MTCSPIRLVTCLPQLTGTALLCWVRRDKEHTMHTHRHVMPWVAVGIVLLTTATVLAQGVGPPAPLTPSLGFIDEYKQLRGIWSLSSSRPRQTPFGPSAPLKLLSS